MFKKQLKHEINIKKPNIKKCGENLNDFFINKKYPKPTKAKINTIKSKM